MTDDFLKQKAVKISNSVDVNDPESVRSWIKGATEKMLRQEKEINALRFQTWTIIMFVFIIPLLMSFTRGSGS